MKEWWTSEGFLIDLDGTLFRGGALIEGADRVIHRLRSLDKRVVFVSNRGNWSRRMCYEKMREAGLDVRLREILLSSTVAARFLLQEAPDAPVWTLGDDGLQQELEDHAVPISPSPEEAKWLVISLHETLTYNDLNQAFRAVRSGAKIVATNADPSFPGENGECIDVAAMIGAIEAATGCRPERVVGKPSRMMAEIALKELRVPPRKTVVIGDSLPSDIRMGKYIGCSTILVLSGSTDVETVETSTIQPDCIIDSIADLQISKE